MRFAGGISQQRTMPKFARQTFKSWFRRRGTRNSGGPPVLLWADTFNNYFHPAVAAAAVEVLEAAGYQVMVPQARLCCGRPLYDYGFLDMAKGYLHRVLRGIRAYIESGTPVVGLEPSCLAVFRDELTDLLPHNHDAQRLSKQSFSLAEFLEKKAQHYAPPRLERKVVVHGHCHQKSIVGMSDERSVLKKMGADANVLDDGCCGMAGSFGFEEHKYDLSMQVFEHELRSQVEHEPKDTIIMADGFSCKTQIEKGTDRQALHLAQIMKMAQDRGPAGVPGTYPERSYNELPRNDGYAGEWLTAGIAAGLLVSGGLLA